MSIRTLVAAAVVCVLPALCTRSEELTNHLEHLRPGMVREFSVPVEQWRFHQPAVPDAEETNFDDSAWQTVAPGFSWDGQNTNASLRARITVPATVGGQPVEGMAVRLQLGMSSRCELFVDGQLRDDFRVNGGTYTLAEHAHPGQTFTVALRPRGPQTNQFRSARLYCEVLPDFDRYVDDVMFVNLLINRLPEDRQATVKQALAASESAIQFTSISPDNLATVRDQLAQARSALLPVAKITKDFDVYYIGHAHIDMNWQWTWPETIDMCRRTWNSAMNLMNEFPELRFVQSQPAAYVPIESQFPDEFARMQKENDLGQWDLVGGLWDESDTDIPSGEGLARSFMLGQRYFKSKFGRYAVTGWLPDSFGHSWQLPQIMKLAGIQNFYHMRCGNGMEFTWWQSPDGSRVLKANTPSYDTRPMLEQLVVPMENQKRFGLSQSLVIFGVGDHGGGPTREQILRIKAYQNDPIFPRVHFINADNFFEHLAKDPVAPSLPVVDSDLQYTFEGCYTTHADMKKSLRQAEDNLYSAEVLSSLAAMTGQPYPVEAFDDAWKPTAFAQFHDIAAGSAIHSTYDWMHEQLAPALKFAQAQTDKSLDALTARTDTRGPGANPIVVWNTLSFSRDDVVRVALPGAAQYHSVVDAQGRAYAAQMDGDALVFVARAVPAFGHAVYFPQTNTCEPDGVTLQDSGDAVALETPTLKLAIAKATGAVTNFYSKAAQWNVFGDATDGNAWQLLGDSGTAWTIRYTGKDHILMGEGAKVTVLDNGPVFARVRVSHAWGKSSFTQDVTVYGALPRVDVPTTVDWHEQAEVLKIRLPVAVAHAEANAQIPSGSIVRPTNGQESPGQKWMDVGEAIPAPVTDARPLDLTPLFNSNCAKDFDGNGGAYPGDRLPGAGMHRLGVNEVPFKLPGRVDAGSDNIVADGQRVALPSGGKGGTLYLLAACANGGHATEISFQHADGAVESWAVPVNDWRTANYPEDTVGLDFPFQHPTTGRKSAPPTMWIVHVPLPKAATAVIFPHDRRVHFFAATIASAAHAEVPHGLSVLNDCKYGFDVTSNLFRLTALRSSGKPDPHPDDGLQSFTYSLYPHAGDWRAARTDEQALGLNIPLLARMATAHPPAGRLPKLALVNEGGKGDLVVSAFKHCEDGNGCILRFYEAAGQDTVARIDFDAPVQAEETDILERPLPRQRITSHDHSIEMPVGHNQIVTLRLTGKGIAMPQ